MAETKKDITADAMSQVRSLLEDREFTDLTLMSIFESDQNDSTAVVTTSQLQKVIGENNLTVVDRLTNLLEEAGVPVTDDLLTREDRVALEQWRKLAGIGE
jgi:glycine cleavage system regulatory protein